MTHQTIRDIMSGRGGPAGGLARAGLWLASKPYGLILRVRRGLYRCGVLRSARAAVPVISVGNITTGGTGKTPMVAWVVGELKKAGRQPAILTRGYKAVAGKSDEAELLWKTTGAPVVVDADRVSAARAAVEAGADVLVLDDGFQHLRLARDLDIVLLDATEPFGYGHVLPRGMLREPVSALADADAIVITRSDLVSDDALSALRAQLGKRAPQAPVYLARHEATAVIADFGRHLPPTALQGRKVCAFCGIGNPDSFFATVERAGAVIVAREVFDDHVAYGPAELERVRWSAAASGAEILLTTAKDRVKIEEAKKLGPPLWTLQVQMQVVEGREELVGKILTVGKRSRNEDNFKGG